ncbi:MAG: hypothetical protein II007_13030 [Gammaproteobacteria bacterium]|nr:hypothetical protein [Gammaproteobacteria bacterium]
MNTALSKQNGIMAAIAVAITASAIWLSWALLGVVYAEVAPLFIPFSGAFVGLAVRAAGRGVFRVFKAMALLGYLLVLVGALVMGIMFTTTMHLAFVLILVLAGLFMASSTSRRALGRDEEKAYFKLLHIEEKVATPLHNSVWLLPLLTTLYCLAPGLWSSSA